MLTTTGATGRCFWASSNSEPRSWHTTGRMILRLSLGTFLGQVTRILWVTTGTKCRYTCRSPSLGHTFGTPLYLQSCASSPTDRSHLGTIDDSLVLNVFFLWFTQYQQPSVVYQPGVMTDNGIATSTAQTSMAPQPRRCHVQNGKHTSISMPTKNTGTI
jgi:hypothetical protein